MLQFKLASFDAMAILRTLAHSGTVVITGNLVTAAVLKSGKVEKVAFTRKPMWLIKSGSFTYLVKDGYMRRLSRTKAQAYKARKDLY